MKSSSLYFAYSFDPSVRRRRLPIIKFTVMLRSVPPLPSCFFSLTWLFLLLLLLLVTTNTNWKEREWKRRPNNSVMAARMMTRWVVWAIIKKSKDKRWILGINYHISIDYCLLFRLLCAIKNYWVVSNFIHEQKIKKWRLFCSFFAAPVCIVVVYFWLPGVSWEGHSSLLFFVLDVMKRNRFLVVREMVRKDASRSKAITRQEKCSGSAMGEMECCL